MNPRFEEIPYADCNRLLQLEEILMKHLPDSVHILVLLKLARQNRFPPEINVKFYIFRDDENEEYIDGDDNPFIVCIERPNMHLKKGIIMLTPRYPTQTQIETFDAFMTWDEPQVFQCIQKRFWDILSGLVKSHGKMVPEDSDGIPGVMFAITNMEKAKNLEVKELSDPNLTVRPLEKADISLAIKQWKWAQPHSEEVLGYCVGTLVSWGIFEKDEIASSVLLSPLGTFNALYTSPKFRNKGLGQYVMKMISKEAAREMETFPLAEIEVWNDPSRKVLTKSGYEEMYLTNWFYYEPCNKE